MAASIVEQDPTDGGSSSGSPDLAESTINDFLSPEGGTEFQACLTPSQPQTQSFECSQHFSRASSIEILEQYSVLWNYYMAEKAKLHDLEQEIKILRSANAQLCLRLQIAEREVYNKSALLAYSEQRFTNLQKNLKNLLHFEKGDETGVNAETIWTKIPCLQMLSHEDTADINFPA